MTDTNNTVSDERLAEMLGAWEADAIANQGFNDHELEVISALTELQSLRSQPEPAGVRVKALAALEELANLPLGIPMEDWSRLSAPILSALTEQKGEAVRWEIIETLPSGSTRWRVVEHEHHAREVAKSLDFPTTIRPLYASPSNQEPVAVTDEMVEHGARAIAAWDLGW